MMNKQTKALKELLEAVEHAIEIGDWKVDGRCDPDLAINRAKKALEQKEQADIQRMGIAGAVEQLYLQSLEQPAQEPVAWMRSALDNARDVCKYLDHDMIKEAKAHTKFFWNDIDKIKESETDTHPAPQPASSWQPNKEFVLLSDDEINSFYEKIKWNVDIKDIVIDFARAIEQALKEKNHE